MTRYRLDRTWRRPGGGNVVLAGSPLRLFRLSAGGAHVMGLVEHGEPPPTESVRQFLDRFVEAGALHPEPDESPFTELDVTVVMPAHDRLPAVLPARTIVVDDASEPPLLPPGDVTVVRLTSNQGPAAARNAGLERVTTPLVAFVDTDVVLSTDWLTPLLGHFHDPRVAAVAPRVASSPGMSAVARHEQRHSPLDLGLEPARVSPGTRVSYLPSAALVCRVDALRALGGFDADMRLGEDVDLVWRLVAAGHRVRYEPASVVLHEPRSSWSALARQRMGYGRSAAPLARRHPGALAPVRMSAWSLAVWALLVARRPWSALAVAVGTGVALQRKLAGVPAAESARLVALGHLAAGRQLAEATRRVWWPLALPALAWRRTRWAVVAALLARPITDFPAAVVDDLSYGAGVWAGAIGEREWGPLTPEFTRWPTRGGG